MTDETLLGAAAAEAGGEAEGSENQGAEGAEGKAAENAQAEGAEGAEGKGEGKADGANGEDKSGEGKEGENAEGADEDALTGAPENYGDFTIPENLTATEEELGEFKEFAKELDLSDKGAQKVIDKFGEQIAKFQDAQQKAWADIQDDWKKETETDKEIGGQNLQKTLQHAQAGLKAFGSPELVELVEQYGLGNNKAVISLLAKVGEAASEGNFHAGGNKANPPKTLAQRIYTQPSE